jgi:uncharacterized membrane protein
MSDIAIPPAADGTHLRNAELDDPWKWLMAGIEDVKRAPLWSLGYGLFFVLVGVGGSVWLWDAGLESLVPVLAGGFALVGPMLAVGLYEISRRLESGEPLNMRDVVFVKTAEPLQLAYMGFALLFMYFVWIRVAMLLYAGFLHLDYTPLDEFSQFLLGTGQGLAFLAIGTAVGAVFAVIVFAATALSVPMLMDRHVDVVSAIAASVRSVTHNPKPMLLWAWLIALLIAFGFATLFVGLIVVFPVIGHATWHAYRSLSAGIQR